MFVRFSIFRLGTMRLAGMHPVLVLIRPSWLRLVTICANVKCECKTNRLEISVRISRC